MVQRRERTLRSGIVLAGLAAFLVVVGSPWSKARAADDTEEPTSKTQYKPQAEDEDRPHDKSLLEKTPTDAAVAKQAQQSSEPLPLYQRWQFWAITGGIVVGAVAAIWGGATLYHALHGGDVRPCNTMAFVGCYGQGEPQ
jgi:hypothetical protein